MTRIPEQQITSNRRTRGLLGSAGRIFAIALLLVACSGAGVFGYFYASSQTFKDTVNTVITGNDSPEKAFPGRDSIDLLLMGRDLDRDERGRVVRTRGRTDAMMLAHIDFRRGTIKILSIPRDTLVHIPGYRHKRRISYANALGGPELAVGTVSEFLGIQPEYYILVDFDSFEKAIDELGGLEITVDKRLDYDDNWGNLHIHLEPGTRLLDGNECMGFVRYRQSNDGDSESDLVRIGRQQELVRAVTARLSSPGTMFRVPRVLDNIRGEIEGNLAPGQMICLARFVKSLSPSEDIQMETLPALNGGGVYVKADPDATRDLVDRMFLDNQQ